MNPTTLVLSLAFIALTLIVEINFKPRLDFTHNNDVLLWFYNRKKERVFIILFHIHQKQ
jgi:hypothetical protein